MDPKRYILIAGHGRSGTNWLLEILDQSQQTHCRNEPNECVGSALSALPSAWVDHPGLTAELESTWDEAIARASRSFGDRDHSIPVYKDHFSRPAQRIGLVRLARGKKIRKALGSVLTAPLPEEWPIPPWVGGQSGGDRLVPVLKVNFVPGWIAWALRNRPEAHVLHIVRHPGGYLNSLIKRWLSRQKDRAAVESVNRALLAQVAAHDPAWAARFGDPGTLSLIEAELWYWLYCAETIDRVGAGNPRYQLIKYEELTRNPVEVSRSLYRGCGLDWDETIEQAIRRTAGESDAIAAAWRDKLDPEYVALVERILDAGVVRDWWD
jgi:hypothetical protein